MDHCRLVALVSVAYNTHMCQCVCAVFSLHACMYPGSLYSFVCMPLCLHTPYDVVCSSLYSVTLTLPTQHTPYTLSPSVCIMFLALPLFVFAGRAKAEPARQTTTKRRKRKNSASSANSSVGTTAGKKRSPTTNFSLSSQVPVSISSTRFAYSFIFFCDSTCMFAGLHTGARYS